MSVKPGYTSIPLWIRQKVLKWYLALPVRDRKRLENPPVEPAPKPKVKRVRKK